MMTGMERLCLILLIVFGACSIHAQTGASDCPSFSVWGPATVVRKGDVAAYRVKFQKADPRKFTYEWSVSAGEIRSGQGTDEIQVVHFKDGITATVKIFGLPSNCADTASETSIPDDPPEIVLLDEYGKLSWKKEAARLTEIFPRVATNPYAQIYVVIRIGASEDERKGQRQVSRIKAFLRDSNIDVGRFEFFVGPGTVRLTHIYLVPPGATPPTK